MMEVIKQSAKVWGYCPDTIEESMLWIEHAARICYQSDDKIKEGSAEKMCKMLVDKGHTAMIEHSWLAVTVDKLFDLHGVPMQILNDPFIHCEVVDQKVYLCGNYRAWINHMKEWVHATLRDEFDMFLNIHTVVTEAFEEYGLPVTLINNEDLPEHLRAFTVQFITSRDVTHELVRHRRQMAFAQKSQRYCADSNDVQFVLPSWAVTSIDIMGEIDQTPSDTMEWLQSMRDAEYHYHELLKNKSPQEARVVLPNSCATEIAVTAPLFQWEWVDQLRTSAAAYPAIRQLINMAREGWECLELFYDAD
jgi:thymidylate synthase (FAD)